MPPSKKKPVRLAITMGEPAGVGPEVALKAAVTFLKKRERIYFVIVGSFEHLRRLRDELGLYVELKKVIPGSLVDWEYPGIQVIALDGLFKQDVSPGSPSKENVPGVIGCIEKAVRMAKVSQVDGIVTAPIDKHVLIEGGFAFKGHTEFLGHLCGGGHPVMMMLNRKLRVALVTTHIPISNVNQALSQDLIIKTIEMVNRDMSLLGISHPRIGICGLNPHASEQGKLGHEEHEMIIPAVKKAIDSGIRIEGPLPADTIFYKALNDRYDVVIAQYHDQGLIPVKTVDFFGSVNITLGLPIIRTSVDHGTAYDIAHLKNANPLSMREAIRWAALMARNRIELDKNHRLN